jgi:hypothetical protein
MNALANRLERPAVSRLLLFAEVRWPQGPRKSGLSAFRILNFDSGVRDENSRRPEFSVGGAVECGRQAVYVLR